MTEKFRENQEVSLVFENAANKIFVRWQIYFKYNKYKVCVSMTALSNQVKFSDELAAGVAWATGVLLNNQESNSLCIHIWCHRKQLICLSSVSLCVCMRVMAPHLM